MLIIQPTYYYKLLKVLFFLQVLREVYKSKSNIIILDCSKEIIGEVLTQALQVGAVSEGYYYLITSLDAHTVDLEAFKVIFKA